MELNKKSNRTGEEEIFQKIYSKFPELELIKIDLSKYIKLTTLEKIDFLKQICIKSHKNIN